MINRSLFAVVALLLSLAAREARADAVPPPPKNCPPGTHGVTGHAGPGCVPESCPPGSFGTMCEGGPCCLASQCGADAGRTCSANSKCQEVKACTKPRNTIGWGASRHPAKEELALCDANGACPGGGTCEALMVCVMATPPAPTSTSAGSSAPGTPAKGKGGCAVSASDAPVSLAIVTALIAAAAAVRRRRKLV